jgi:DNA processing protein
MDNKKISWIKLSLVPFLGAKRFAKLVEFFTDAEKVFKADVKTLQEVEGITENMAEYIVSKKDKIEYQLKKELDLIKKEKVKIIALYEDDYPKPLRNIYDSPALLYVKGEYKEMDAISVSIVGTRYPSNYGAKAAYDFGRELGGLGITVVSGLARGIDSEAHKGALKSGRTIAVVGTGLGMCYPPENKKLMNEISENGSVISEFPMTMYPDKSNFPIRNRVISGLSLGTLVIEAKEKSGALITARNAMEQGRDVFAVPGLINNPRTFGTHSLIQDGAKLVTNCSDIINEIPALKNFIKVQPEFFNLGDKNIKLSKEEQAIYSILKYEDKMQIEEICAKSDASVIDVMRILTSLELKNVVKQLPGKFYCNAL